MYRVLSFKYVLVTLLLAFLGLAANQTRAEVELFQPDRFAELDHAWFKASDSDLVRLELYYKIFNSGLMFREEKGQLIARYEVIIKVFDGDNMVGSEHREREIVAASKGRAASSQNHRTSQWSVDLKPDKYRVEFSIRDQHSNRLMKENFKAKLPSFYHRYPKMARLEFVQAFHKRKANVVGPFDKGDAIVVPSVTRDYGGQGGSGLAYYLEVYPGSDDLDNVVIETKLIHRVKGMTYRDTLHVSLANGTNRQLREVSLEHLTPGEYEIEIYLRGRRNKKIDYQRHDFEVMMSLEGMLRNDWKTTILQLELIAKAGEIDKLKQAKALEDRREAFDEFWLNRDPSIGTAENEARDEFYKRIAIANRAFRILRRQGWRSDRGRVFIRYGPPDEVNDEPYSPDRLPYQVWHYYTAGPYRRFLFVDENTDGDYRLQFPYDGLGQRPDF